MLYLNSKVESSSRENVQGKLEAAAGMSSNKQSPPREEEEMDLRRGPWTVEEDLLLIDYIAKHGDGRWNSLALCAGLKRTGKSCRLRWLNYLRPDVRRGNITAEEQLLILELHTRWGNRWSKIAQYLPGRTDNEIKNYWRTRVQKHAKQLQCDVNSKKFKDAVRYIWIPRLAERIQTAAASAGDAEPTSTSPRPTATTAGHGCFESSDVSALSSNDSAQTAARFCSPPPELDGRAPAEHAATSGCDNALDVHGTLQGEMNWTKSAAAVPEIFEDQCVMDWGGEFGGPTTLWSLEDIWSMQ